MYVGFDPSASWSSERPSPGYAEGLNRNQTVMRAGTVQAVYPIMSRDPGVLSEMFNVVGRRNMYTQGRSPARNDSEAVRRAYDAMMAQQQPDGSVLMTPSGVTEAIRQVKSKGQAVIPVAKLNGTIGSLTITPDDIIKAPPGRLDAMRRISQHEAQGGYARQGSVSTRPIAAGYGWRR